MGGSVGAPLSFIVIHRCTCVARVSALFFSAKLSFREYVALNTPSPKHRRVHVVPQVNNGTSSRVFACRHARIHFRKCFFVVFVIVVPCGLLMFA